MHIQKINPITFGYNRKLNRQLEKKLNHDNSDLEETSLIKDLNTLCNNTEDLLRLHDSTGSDKAELYYQSLLPMKILLAKLVDYKFPDLNFTKKESESYEREAYNIKIKQNNAYPWQLELASELDLSQDKEKDLTPEQKEQVFQAVINSRKTETAKLPEENNLIQVFEPDISSPTGFESLGGMDELKEEMNDKIIIPTLNPELAKQDYEEYGKRAPRGILFYGPPGCGKTFMAEALSMESSIPLLKFQISKLGSKYINETSTNYQAAFDYAEKYSKAVGKPVILFIDEIDGFTHNRSNDSSAEDLKQIGTLLNMIEKARDRNIIVIGATNKYDIVDDAIKRRFDEQIYVGMPDQKVRADVLKLTLSKRLKGKSLAQNSADIEEIASKLKGFPTSAIVIIADKASDRARKDGRREITKEDFFTEINQNENLKIKEQNYKSGKSIKIGYN